MAIVDPNNVSFEMKRYRAQKSIEKEVTKRERKWYKQRDEIEQKKRLAEIRKIIEKETNYDY